MNILITGAAGMIGSHLADFLLHEKDCKILAIDNLSVGKLENIETCLKDNRFQFLKEDITDKGLKDKIGNRPIDIIFHLAAEKKGGEKDNSYRTLFVNSQGTENMLNMAFEKKAKFILASTSDVYGASTKIPFSENDDLTIGSSNIKRWAYAVSKIFDEQLAFSYYYSHHLPIVILRYFGGFSERSSQSWRGGHIPCFINAIMNNEPATIHGDGTQTRSMAYVEDIVRGTCLAAFNKQAEGEIFNIGNDEEISVLDSAKIIHRIYCDLSKSTNKLKINHIPMKQIFGNYKEIQRRKPDLNKAKKILDFTPQYDFKTGIAKVLKEMIK